MDSPHGRMEHNWLSERAIQCVQTSRKETYWETWELGSTVRLAASFSGLILDGIGKLRPSSSNGYYRRLENRRATQRNSDIIKMSSLLFE
jgi:hypothetical protein